MLRDLLEDLFYAQPFEPFRIKLVNGDFFDVFDPKTVALEQHTLSSFPHDQNWVIVPIDKINSVESLIADYHGQAASFETPPP